MDALPPGHERDVLDEALRRGGDFFAGAFLPVVFLAPFGDGSNRYLTSCLWPEEHREG